MLDAGLDLGKTAEQSLTLLRASRRWPALGYPLLLSASNKTFLGKILDLEMTERARGLARRGGPRDRLGLPHCAGARRPGHLPGPRRCWPRSARRREQRAGAASVVPGRGRRPRPGGPGGRAARWPTWWATRDHALVVEEIGGGPGDDLDVGAVVDACLTPPFLIDRRVVVVRDAGRLLTADAPRLVEVVQDPLPTTVLVLVGGGGTVPAPLVKAVTAAGQVIDVADEQAPGTARPGCTSTSATAPVKLEPRAADLLADHVGEDLGRVEGLLGALARRLRRGGAISADDLAPYLGEAGNVAPLRADRRHRQGRARPGPRGAAPHARRRRAGARSRCSPRCTGTSPTCWCSTGDDVAAASEAAAAPRLRALRRPRRRWSSHAASGSARIAEAINLIAEADLDVRGASGLAAEIVVEILVARLAARPGRGPARGPALVATIGRVGTPPAAPGPPRTPPQPPCTPRAPPCCDCGTCSRHPKR